MIAIDYLPLIALGAMLGVLGQSIRALIGIRKIYVTRDNPNKLIDIKYLMISLLIGFVIGCCGLLLIHQDYDEPLFSHHIMLIIALGYAGTDVVEGVFFPQDHIRSNKFSGKDEDI